MTCPDCVRDLEHCHGTLVVCDEATVECTDDACIDSHRERHDLVIVLPGG